MTPKELLKAKQQAACKAIDILDGTVKAAKKLKIKNTTVVTNWKKRGVSRAWVEPVAKATKLTKPYLRPDIFTAPT